MRLPDFANDLLGGGVQTGVRAQEELLFCTRPEACVAMALCARMRDDESVSVRGSRRFAAFVGRGRAMKAHAVDDPA